MFNNYGRCEYIKYESHGDQFIRYYLNEKFKVDFEDLAQQMQTWHIDTASKDELQSKIKGYLKKTEIPDTSDYLLECRQWFLEKIIPKLPKEEVEDEPTQNEYHKLTELWIKRQSGQCKFCIALNSRFTPCMLYETSKKLRPDKVFQHLENIHPELLKWVRKLSKIYIESILNL